MTNGSRGVSDAEVSEDRKHESSCRDGYQINDTAAGSRNFVARAMQLPTSPPNSLAHDMAPHAVKRRKLSHDSDEDSSDGGVDTRLAANDDDQSDVSADDVVMSHEEDSTKKKAQPQASKKTPQKAQKENRKGPHRDRDMAELTGAYTGEVYKSNMFKLQVDELLDQIRPKHGKKEAAAEKALRELKAIVENIPAREPLSVSFARLLRLAQHNQGK